MRICRKSFSGRLRLATAPSAAKRCSQRLGGSASQRRSAALFGTGSTNPDRMLGWTLSGGCVGISCRCHRWQKEEGEKPGGRLVPNREMIEVERSRRVLRHRGEYEGLSHRQLWQR